MVYVYSLSNVHDILSINGCMNLQKVSVIVKLLKILWVSGVSVLQYYCNNEAIFVPCSPYETAILKGFQPTGSAFLNLP